MKREELIRKADDLEGTHAKVIINPMAGNCSVRKGWPQFSRLLHDAGLSFDYEFTKGKGHAIKIAKQATDTGYSYLIAVGGDGTINEVANGILTSTHSSNTILGIVSAGSACSFAHSLNIPRDYISICSILTGRGRTLIDVGTIKCQSGGRTIQRFFLNVSSTGFTASVVDIWKHLPNRYGHNITHVLRAVGGLKVLSTYRNKRILLRLENETKAIRVCAIIIANGSYFGGGMQIAPRAKLNDSLLDVVIVGDVGRFELLKLWPTLYRGTHIEHPKISEEKTRTVTIESDEQLLVEADGDIVGKTPVSFSVIPSALTIVT